ncbi:hypothetical protein RHMOL_Rhmol02G0141600 [Rhododendron molle]|uniref:Uncharacterized protein n=1 Tax=Rhododendron molle TaxID=49168 RepID=A0ACC0PRD8_RHOML|nr:hypothetical protein RHMOL_Rhmol02G0141600 [Rhododendron molle]
MASSSHSSKTGEDSMDVRFVEERHMSVASGFVEESPRVVHFGFDVDQVMLRLMKLESNMDGMMLMMK